MGMTLSETSVVQPECSPTPKGENPPAQQCAVEWPRITLVTPVLNAAPYIEQTIRSVVFQGYPNLEYIIVDGGSDDGTIDIIRKYENYLTRWVSEEDSGMYEALNKGFSETSGEIMGWIGATDMLHVRSLFVVGSVFKQLTGVKWITGIPTLFNEDGLTVAVADLRRWSRTRFLAGANRYIQQESTFWRRDLWEEAGGYVDASRRMASDFELWVRFFRHASLCSVRALIGGFRSHSASRGLQMMDKCHQIHDEIIEAELNSLSWGWALRVFRKMGSGILRIPPLRGLWQRLIIRALYEKAGPDWPPLISFDDGQGWVLGK